MKKNLLLSTLSLGTIIMFSGCFGGYSTKLKYSEVQANINSYSEEDQLKAVEYYFNNVKGIKNPSYKVQYAAVYGKKGGGCTAYELIQNPSEEISKQIVSACGIAIKNIKNPTEKQVLYALDSYPEYLKSIKNPTYEQKMVAVKRSPKMILDIDNPSEDFMLEVVKSNPEVIKFIKNPSEKIQLEVVKKQPLLIEYINNPSENIQIEAIKGDSTVLEYIKNIDFTYKAQLEGVKKHGLDAYIHCKNQTNEMHKILIDKDPTNIEYIKNPSEELKKIAYSKINILEKKRIARVEKEAKEREELYAKYNISTNNSNSVDSNNEFLKYSYYSTDNPPRQCVGNQRLSIGTMDMCRSNAEASGKAWAHMALTTDKINTKDKELVKKVCEHNTNSSVWNGTGFEKYANSACLNGLLY